MLKTVRALRRHEGKCIQAESCENPVPKGRVRCLLHLEKDRRSPAKKARQVAGYYELKAAGLCTKCRKPAFGDASQCWKCLQKAKAHTNRRRKLVGARNKDAATRREWRLKRAEAGVCIQCNSPIVTATLCERHRIAACKRTAKSRGLPLPTAPDRRIVRKDEGLRAEFFMRSTVDSDHLLPSSK